MPLSEKSVRATLKDRDNPEHPEHKHTHVTDIRKESLFGIVDSSQTGLIDQAQFNQLYDAIKADADEETAREAEMERTVKKTRRRMKMFGVFALVLGIFLAVSVACNFAVMFVVVDSQVKTKTSNDVLRDKESNNPVKVASVDFAVANERSMANEPVLTAAGSDNIVATRAASEQLPLMVAPMLSADKLDSVASITVTDYDEANVRDTYQRHYVISGYVWHDASYVVFDTSRGDKLHIQRALAWIERLDGTRRITCANNVNCAAFTSEGTDAPTLIAAARELWKEIDLSEGRTAQPEVGWKNQRSEEDMNEANQAGDRRKLNNWRKHAKDPSTKKRARHPAYVHAENDACGGRRRLSSGASEGSGQLDWSWMHGGLVDSADEARRLEEPAGEGSYSYSYGSPYGEPAQGSISVDPRKKFFSRVGDSADTQKWASMEVEQPSTPEYGEGMIVADDGTITCEGTANCTALWIKYQFSGWMEQNMELGSLVCLVCKTDHGPDASRRALQTGTPQRRYKSTEIDPCAVDGVAAKADGYTCTTCEVNLQWLVSQTKGGSPSQAIKVLSNANYLDEVEPSSYDASKKFASREQALSFFTRQYMDDMLHQYQTCEEEALVAFGAIGGWDVSPARDLSWYLRQVPPMCADQRRCADELEADGRRLSKGKGKGKGEGKGKGKGKGEGKGKGKGKGEGNGGGATSCAAGRAQCQTGRRLSKSGKTSDLGCRDATGATVFNSGRRLSKGKAKGKGEGEGEDKGKGKGKGKGKSSQKFVPYLGFNEDINAWDVSSVTSTAGLFAFSDYTGQQDTTGQQLGLNGWDVSSVQDMNSMFVSAKAFNGKISDWDVGWVTDMSHMFESANNFKGDGIGNTSHGWNTQKCSNMTDMFKGSDKFEEDISSWKVGNVIPGKEHDFKGGKRLRRTLASDDSAAFAGEDAWDLDTAATQ